MRVPVFVCECISLHIEEVRRCTVVFYCMAAHSTRVLLGRTRNASCELKVSVGNTFGMAVLAIRSLTVHFGSAGRPSIGWYTRHASGLVSKLVSASAETAADKGRLFGSRTASDARLYTTAGHSARTAVLYLRLSVANARHSPRTRSQCRPSWSTPQS